MSENESGLSAENDAPIRVCCGQRHYGPVCPDGLVMCCICFNRVTKDRLALLEHGVVTFVAVLCYAAFAYFVALVNEMTLPPNRRILLRPRSRELTRRDERRLARRFSHEQRPWRPCYATGGRLCLRCLLRDVLGINRRAKRRYVAEMRKRAAMIPPAATRRYRRLPDGSFKRID